MMDELCEQPYVAAPQSQYYIGDDSPYIFVQRQQELIQQQTSELDRIIREQPKKHAASNGGNTVETHQKN